MDVVEMDDKDDRIISNVRYDNGDNSYAAVDAYNGDGDDEDFGDPATNKARAVGVGTKREKSFRGQGKGGG